MVDLFVYILQTVQEGEVMKKIVTLLISLLLVLTMTGCKKDGYTIAVPNDTTNEARALIILENLGLIKLKEGAGITATKLDIESNPYNIDIQEIEAAQIPNIRQDVDFAIINSNYAISAGINPSTDALALEGSYSAYSNILAVKQGRENEEGIQLLLKALQSKEVADYIASTYNGAVISTVDNPEESILQIDRDEPLKVTVAASPTPHAEILEVAKKILKAVDVELEIIEFDDYVKPNTAVESGEVDANYFQHVPYLDDFNAQNGTHIISVGGIHVEPMGIYPGKLSSLEEIK